MAQILSKMQFLSRSFGRYCVNQITLQSPVKLTNDNVEDSSEKAKNKNQTWNTAMIMILYSNNHDYSNVDASLFS